MRLPYEVWEQILDLLATPDLLGFQLVCQEWRDVVNSYAMNGRLKSRALVRLFLMCFSSLHIL